MSVIGRSQAHLRIQLYSSAGKNICVTVIEEIGISAFTRIILLEFTENINLSSW